jgi:predicted branched-subunit amino acid permease
MEVRQPKQDDDIRFDKHDIAAVANSRFFRKKGLKVLLIWAFITLAITMIYNYTQAFPPFVAYVLFGVNAVVFVYLYSKMQTEVRVKLWENIERNRMAKQDEVKNEAQVK